MHALAITSFESSVVKINLLLMIALNLKISLFFASSGKMGKDLEAILVANLDVQGLFWVIFGCFVTLRRFF